MQKLTRQGGQAVCYLRITRPDVPASHIRADLEKLHEYATKLGLTMKSEYVDVGYSADTLNRPAFRQLIQDCIDDDSIEYCLVLSFGTISRKLTDYATALAVLNLHGVTLCARDVDLSNCKPRPSKATATSTTWHTDVHSTSI